MYYPRLLSERLEARVSSGKVRLLFGPRQTGKTALLENGLSGGHRIDLGAPSVRRAYEADPGRLSRELGALPRTTRAVILDEIQKVPGLLDEIQIRWIKG